MNLPWDKSYFKLCFYIIFTFMICYLFKIAVDGVVYVFGNVGGVYKCLINIIAYVTSIFSVLILGFAIAYVLNPVADFLCNKTKNRLLGVALTYIGILAFLILLVVLTILEIRLGGKISLLEGINLIIADYRHNIENVYVDILFYLDKYHLEFVTNYISYFTEKFSTSMNSTKEFSMAYNILTKIATFLLSLIISFYLLKDRDSMLLGLKNISQKLLPKRVYSFLSVNIIELDEAFSGYVRGQLMDGIIMSGIISVVLAMLGIKFPLIIGLISGLSNIIPYFGALVGFVLSIFMALINGDTSNAVIVALAIIILQQIDGYIISPKILGHTVKLNPVVIIIALAVGGKLLGVLGMVLAIPIVRFAKIKIDKIS